MAKLFSKSLMESEDVKALLTSAHFQTLGADAPVDDGAFVVLGEYLSDNTYGVGGKNFNVHLATAPAALTDKVAVVDLAEISEGTICGNDYKIGSKTTDLVLPAGRNARARKLRVGDKFYLGEGNFTGAINENGYAILTVGDTRLTPAAAQGANFAVKILSEKDLTIGQRVSGKIYLVEVVGL